MSVTYSVTYLIFLCYLSLICLLLVCCTVCYLYVTSLLNACYFVLKDATYQAYYCTSNQWIIVSTTTDSTVLIKDTYRPITGLPYKMSVTWLYFCYLFCYLSLISLLLVSYISVTCLLYVFYLSVVLSVTCQLLLC